MHFQTQCFKVVRFSGASTTIIEYSYHSDQKMSIEQATKVSCVANIFYREKAEISRKKRGKRKKIEKNRK